MTIGQRTASPPSPAARMGHPQVCPVRLVRFTFADCGRMTAYPAADEKKQAGKRMRILHWSDPYESRENTNYLVFLAPLWRRTRRWVGLSVAAHHLPCERQYGAGERSFAIRALSCRTVHSRWRVSHLLHPIPVIDRNPRRAAA